MLNTNLILMADSYKFSHYNLYPRGTRKMFSYIESRAKGEIIVPFGLQMYLMKYLQTPITMENIDEAEEFMKLHGEPFNREGWEKVVNVYGGLLPIKIRAVPEGTRVPSGNVLITVECDDEDLFWLASWIETSLQRAVWYPSTIASNDYKNWRAIRRFALETCDDLSSVAFSLHCFGARGVSSSESAEGGGAAHMIYFMGSDTVEGIRAANYYYMCKMAGFSVIATEHTIQCSYGELMQEAYFERVIEVAKSKGPGTIISVVLDGYDTFREVRTLCGLRDKIVAAGVRVVFRPDSGDPLEIIPEILRLQEAAFGSTINSKGYRVINNVGVIQGDGVDHDSMIAIMEKITSLGYSMSNIVFGSGGALLQKVNRDTYKFAMKASAIYVPGAHGMYWKPVFKNPVTDPGKRSKAGRLTLVRSRLTQEYMTVDIDQPLDSEFEDVMLTVYENGVMSNMTTLEEVRARATA